MVSRKAIREWFESWGFKNQLFEPFLFHLAYRPQTWEDADGVILFTKHLGREWTLGLQSWTLMERGRGREAILEGLNPWRKWRMQRAVARWRRTRGKSC